MRQSKLVSILTEQNLDFYINNQQELTDKIDVFEFRLDLISVDGFCEIKKFKSFVNKPVIFTLRSIENGGEYSGSEAERLSTIFQFANLQPDYIDIEDYVDEDFIIELKKQYPTIKIIRSYHNFDNTPDNLDEILRRMQHPSCDIYKLITTARTSIDCLNILNLVQGNSDSLNLVAHCMGEIGKPTRVLGAVLGNYFTYASLDNSLVSVPGIISIDDFYDLYNFRNLNQKTKFYALIGDPVNKSAGHIFHNKEFAKKNKNAVYVKMLVTEQILPKFIQMTKDLPFAGFSVTIPLKEEIMSFVDQMDSCANSIGAINTIRVNYSKFYATNTDAAGALDALEKIKLVDSKNILILGAGGAAKAIAYEASRRGGEVFVQNRTLSKAQNLAEKVGGKIFDPSLRYDFVINTLPGSLCYQSPTVDLINKSLNVDSVFMDINYNQHSCDYSNRKKIHSKYFLDGYEMFVNQAYLQQDYFNELPTVPNSPSVYT